MLLVEVLRAALPAGRLSQSAPAAGLVSGALIDVRIDKRFGQRHRMPPTLFPVLREARQHQLHKPADQIGAPAQRQNQQPRIIDHQRQARAPLLLNPADEAVASSDVQRRGTPSGQRHPLAPIFGHVTKMFAHQLGAFQIMMFGDESVAFFDSISRHKPYDQMR